MGCMPHGRFLVVAGRSMMVSLGPIARIVVSKRRADAWRRRGDYYL